MNALKLSILLFCLAGCWNQDKIDPKLMKLPNLKLLTLDSTTILNVADAPKDHSTVILYFNPECGYSQQQVQRIIENINEVKDVQFYMLTRRPFHSLTEFSRNYKLENYKNVIVGTDYEDFVVANFPIKTVPWTFIYDKHRTLKKIIKGLTTLERIKELAEG